MLLYWMAARRRALTRFSKRQCFPQQVRQVRGEGLHYRQLKNCRRRRTYELVGKTAATPDPALRCRFPQDHAGRPVGQVPVLRSRAVSHRPGIESARLSKMQPSHAHPCPRPSRQPARRRGALRHRPGNLAGRYTEIQGQQKISRPLESGHGSDRRDRCAGGHGRRHHEPARGGRLLEFEFMGGSMGSVVGERFVRGAQIALEQKVPFICITATGGARMQEGLLSLMQMAKTTAMLTKLSEKKLPFISVLTDPTMGGVSASFAFMGDVVIAEPKALIGFAGPRVIENTVREKLPEGFQRAEFLVQKGAVDMIVDRRKMREEIARLLALLQDQAVEVLA